MFKDITIQLKDKTSYQFPEAESFGLTQLGFLTLEIDSKVLMFNFDEVLYYDFIPPEDKERTEDGNVTFLQ